tara:strand:+ start:1003 stop:1506 length:504 start_codon:yes stop_codon:yes gene_type:complete
VENSEGLIDVGCVDESACNHDENAVLDDNSCIYAVENFDCDGNCIVGFDCDGVCGGEDFDCYESCDSCYYSYTSLGSDCCDTAWFEYGINCESLESDYSWNCYGCECPGDSGNDNNDVECSQERVPDCSGDGDCCLESWIGDGYCDGADQQWGCDLTCYNNDGGDCP